MRKRNFIIVFILMITTCLMLVACSDDSSTDTDSNDNAQPDSNKNDKDTDLDDDAEPDTDSDGTYSIEDFKATKTNEGEPMDGGEITVGLVSSTPFAGTLLHVFYVMSIDDTIMGWFQDGILEKDENFNYTQDGPATFEIDESKKVWTITIRDNVNWHDGEPLKAEDLEFAYEIIGHPDYEGSWYGSDERNVEGMEEYHAGEADSISGIKVIDEKTIEITFLEADPFVDIWRSPVPKHIFGDMTLDEMAAAPEVRERPIGYGPFKVERIVPGESVVLTKNEDYWRGEPNLDQVTLKVIDPSNVVQEVKTGGVDITPFEITAYPDNDNLTNVEILADTSNGIQFIDFVMGTWDEETNEVKPDPSMKMANKNLRQAMWHAVDTGRVVEQFYHGLIPKGTTMIAPFYGEYHDTTNPGREYDPDKANQLLDEAGYEWADGEDYRTDPDGNEFTLIFAATSGGDIAEPMAKYYMQAWGEIGLNVELYNGRLMETNNFYDMLNSRDDYEVDVVLSSFGQFSNPDPRIFNGKDSMFNYPRYQSEESNALLEAAGSIEGFDNDFLIDTYNKWQELMVEEVPRFPTRYGTAMRAVNNRVVNYTIDRAEKIYYHQLGVTQDKPYVDGE